MTDIYTALTANGSDLMMSVLADTRVPDGEDVSAILQRVCEDINTLTFNRITDFFALTEFQRGILLRVCARLLQFRIDNADLLDSTLNSYAINGVSMGFNEAAVKRVNGVMIPGDVYALLRQTGLTCLRI